MASALPTLLDLERMAREHVRYELTRMAYLANHDPREGGVFGEAALEAGLVHVRVLAGFLGTGISKQYPDQIVAAHYFEGVGDWKPTLPFPDEDYRHLHKRIVHLSTDRLAKENGPQHFQWNYKGGRHWFAGQVLRGFTRFHDSLRRAEADRAEWFTDGLHDAKRIFRGLA